MHCTGYEYTYTMTCKYTKKYIRSSSIHTNPYDNHPWPAHGHTHTHNKDRQQVCPSHGLTTCICAISPYRLCPLLAHIEYIPDSWSLWISGALQSSWPMEYHAISWLQCLLPLALLHSLCGLTGLLVISCTQRKIKLSVIASICRQTMSFTLNSDAAEGGCQLS